MRLWHYYADSTDMYGKKHRCILYDMKELQTSMVDSGILTWVIHWYLRFTVIHWYLRFTVIQWYLRFTVIHWYLRFTVIHWYLRFTVSLVINPYLTNGFSHHCQLGESTYILRCVRSDFDFLSHF